MQGLDWGIMRTAKNKYVEREMTQPKMSLSDYTFLIVKIKYFIIVVDAYEDQVLSITLFDRWY